MIAKSPSELMKQQMTGYAVLNRLTMREKKDRLPKLSLKESLRQFLELETFAEASGSLTKPSVFSLRSYRHILLQREAFRKLAEHA